jgi:hypothetical protein
LATPARPRGPRDSLSPGLTGSTGGGRR